MRRAIRRWSFFFIHIYVSAVITTLVTTTKSCAYICFHFSLWNNVNPWLATVLWVKQSNRKTAYAHCTLISFNSKLMKNNAAEGIEKEMKTKHEIKPKTIITEKIEMDTLQMVDDDDDRRPIHNFNWLAQRRTLFFLSFRIHMQRKKIEINATSFCMKRNALHEKKMWRRHKRTTEWGIKIKNKKKLFFLLVFLCSLILHYSGCCCLRFFS